jgi:hypothetical protein
MRQRPCSRRRASVAELMPPDSAGIRYGLIDRVSAPERLAQVELVSLRRLLGVVRVGTLDEVT